VIPLLLSVMMGAGVLLLYEGLTNPRPEEDAPATGAGDSGGRLAGLRDMREFLARAGLHDVTPRDFLLFSGATCLAAGLATQVLLGWGVVSMLAAALGLAAPFAYYVHRHDRRRAALQEALADAIAQLRDSIRTGLSVQDAFVGLARNGPEALRPELARLVRQMRLDGFGPALAAMRGRLSDPVFDVVAESLALNDRLGGRNVSRVLDRLAHATREQLRIREEIRATQARNVLAARMVAAVPLVLLVAIRRVNPAYLAVFDGALGQLLLAGCLASTALGYAAMLWITRLPDERRVLG
jgi:tight adherence protein B